MWKTAIGKTFERWLVLLKVGHRRMRMMVEDLKKEQNCSHWKNERKIEHLNMAQN